MELGNDEFAISYDPAQVDVERIMDRVRSLGYRPERVTEVPGERQVAVSEHMDVPALVRDALARARTAKRLTFIDFYATWCGPCRVLEATVLSDPRVRDVLTAYEVLKVDTDQHVDSSVHFKVVGLPTLIVLDDQGVEIYRWVGKVEPEELAQRLGRFAEVMKH